MEQKDLSKLRILVIDDELINIELLTEMLDVFGCTNVESTTSPLKGIEMLEAKDFDVVLLDLTMPEMSGFDVLERFSEMDKKCKPKVIVLTGHIGDDVRDEALKNGAADLLTKPFYPETLAEVIG